MIDVTVIAPEVRRALDEYTLDGELIAFDSNVEDVASSNFSNADLYDRLLDGARYIAARCRAAYLSELIETINPTDESELIPPGDNSTVERPFLRLLASRVKYNGVSASRRTFSAHLSADKMAPSTAYPVYIFEDYEFVMAFGTGDKSSDGNASGEANVTAEVVLVPMFLSGTGTERSTYDGVDWTGDLNIPLDAKFRAAVVYYTVASCFATLRLPELAAQYRKNMFEELRPFLRPRYLAQDRPEVTQV